MMPTLVSVAGLARGHVHDAAGEDIGRVHDLVVRWDGGAAPRLTGLVVTIGHRRSFVHAGLVTALAAHDVELASTRFDLRDYQRREGEWLVLGDLLDHQLVDVDGARVVRAADFYLERIGEHYELVAVDVSFRSFLRRTLPSAAARRPTPERVLAWSSVQPLGRPGEPMRLRTAHAGLRAMRPAEFADLLEDLARPERSSLFAMLETEHAAQVLEEMEPRQVQEVLLGLPAHDAAELLGHMAPDEAGDALRDLSADDQQQILQHLGDERSDELSRLAGYSYRQAGGLMTTYLVFVHPDTTITEARAIAIQHRRTPDVSALVVVDDDGRLVDDLPLVELLAADPPTRVADHLGPPVPVTVGPDADLRDVVDTLTANRGTSLLVVDDERRPIGRILADDVVDALAFGRRRRWPWQPRRRADRR